MKTLNYKIITLLLIFVTTIAGAQEDYTKKYHEEYDVKKGDLFEISNHFGNIKIENTDSDKITIDAVVIVKAKSDEKAEKVLNKIDIEIGKSANTVTAKTEIQRMSNNKVSFEIDYTVVMPAYLNTNLINTYGNVTINELLGKSNLKVKYGSINVNKLLDNNEKPLSSVDIGYCEHSSINEFNWGKVVINYSKLEIGKGKALAIASKYSKLRMGKISSLVAESAYDDYEIGEIINLKMDAKYTKVDVDKLYKKMYVDNQYGNVSVNSIPDGFDNIDVVNKYAKVNLGIDKSANYLLDARASYADVKHNDIMIQQRIKEDFHIKLRGYSGNENSKSTVKVSSDYGDVDLRE